MLRKSSSLFPFLLFFFFSLVLESTLNVEIYHISSVSQKENNHNIVLCWFFFLEQFENTYLNLFYNKSKLRKIWIHTFDNIASKFSDVLHLNFELTLNQSLKKRMRLFLAKYWKVYLWNRWWQIKFLRDCNVL